MGWAVGLFLAMLLPICMLAYKRDFGNQETWWRYFFSWSLGLGLFLLLTTQIRLRQRALVRLGVVSYSIYLLHPLIGIPIVHFTAGQASTSLAMAYGAIVLGAAASIIAAAAGFRLIEAPAIALGRTITARVIAISHAKVQPVDLSAPTNL